MRETGDSATGERLAHRAVELADALLREARAQQTAEERAQARKLARMMADPHGKELTIALADQAFRSRRPERIADQLAYLLERYGVPQYMDMEEDRDLDLTVTAFREVLDEPEFLPSSAGVVLQAYLPDSHRVQRAVTEWALARRTRGGAPIKLRIVKGANLAMERIEAAQHGWPQAPYETKVEVDANYKRMLEYGCRLLANGRLELRWYLREQTVSRMLHRYGSVAEPGV